MKVEDFTFKKHDWFTYATFSEGITQARQSGLCEKYPIQIPEIFETRNNVELQTSGRFYLAVIYNPSCAIWFKKSPMGVHTISNIMKKRHIKISIRNIEAYH